MSFLPKVLLGLLGGLAWGFTAQAQDPLRVAEEVLVFEDGRALPLAWAGGLNSPVISAAHLDEDGRLDLIVYDKSSTSTHGFLRIGHPDTPAYRYAPEYDQQFVERGDWAIYRDYDGDGLADLFSYTTAGCGVWRASRESDGSLTYTVVKDRLTYNDGGTLTPIFTSRGDLPGIQDINGDGDLDLLTFGTFGGFIRYYENQSVESGWGTDSLVFEWTTACYGQWYEGSACKGGDLNTACFAGPDDGGYAERIHAGSTIATLDRNFDGIPDILLGDAGCNNVVLLRNGGSAVSALITGQDITWPPAAPFDMPTFPGIYTLDLNEDGRDDAIVAPTDFGEALNDQQVLAYVDRGGPDSAEYLPLPGHFLVGDMIDEGTDSRAVFFDADADGLMDILVGRGIWLGDTAIGPQGGLSWYRNVGSPELAAFNFETRDYAGLASLGLQGLAPAFGDLDDDGDMDMILGDANGELHRLENIAAAGSPADFQVKESPYAGISVGDLAVPFLFDVNRDGKLDLLIGERVGKIQYYRNIGTPSSPSFLLETNFWGGVDVRSGPLNTGHAAPWLRINDLNQMELYVAARNGRVYRYANLDGNLLGTFTLADTFYAGLDAGLQASFDLYDVNGDDTLDVLMGCRRGGLQLYTGKGVPDAPPVGLAPLAGENPSISLWPNPATHTLFWSLPQDYSTGYEASLVDALGRQVAATVFGNGSQDARWDLPSGLNTGLYVLLIRPQGDARNKKHLLPVRQQVLIGYGKH